MQLKDKTILIVEDDADIRNTMSMIFSMQGWDVFEAEEGYQALEVFKQSKASVILTDINMPFKSDGTKGMDGIELINEITSLYPDDKPLFFVNSGCLTNEILTNKMNTVLAYFAKPTPVMEMITSIEKEFKSN